MSRIKAGAVPHAMSLEQKAPWLELGISRRTYFRRQREKRQGLCPTCTVCTDSSAAAKSLGGERELPNRRAVAISDDLARAVRVVGENLYVAAREAPVTDAPENPVNDTARAAAESFQATQTDSAPDGAIEESLVQNNRNLFLWQAESISARM